MALLPDFALRGWLLRLAGYCTDSGGRHANRALSKKRGPRSASLFCFEYTARTITKDVRTGGESSIKAAITDACRKGADDCEI